MARANAPFFGLVTQFANSSRRRRSELSLSTDWNNSSSNGTDEWYTRRVLAIELEPGGRVLGLAHHQGDVAQYFDEPHASVNRDFTKVVFNSDWGTGGGVDTYLIDKIDWIGDVPR